MLAGVGGQGVLSIAAIIAQGAMREGLRVKQSETHGMAQRGGAVAAHLRLADDEIASDLISHGGASMILSMEPLEALRYLEFLAADGILITACEPVANIADYPPLDEVLNRVRGLPRSVLVDTLAIARRAGSSRSANVALVGAAARYLPLAPDSLERAIAHRFRDKDEKVLSANLGAFRAALREA